MSHDQLEPDAKSASGNILPSGEIHDCMDLNWNDWICQTRVKVNVTIPLEMSFIDVYKKV